MVINLKKSQQNGADTFQRIPTPFIFILLQNLRSFIVHDFRPFVNRLFALSKQKRGIKFHAFSLFYFSEQYAVTACAATVPSPAAFAY